MKINNLGLELIKEFEGLVLTAYPDPATGGDPWTIGYGQTGPSIKKGLVITKKEAEDLLKKELSKYENEINNLQINLNENEFSALVSFCYNCGITNFKNSTLLKLIKLGDKQKASLEFEKWNKANGKVMAGLTRRRIAEKNLFLKKT